MPSYKLYYFNARGRAETIRLAFVVSGIKFEDKRIEKEQWPALKSKTFGGQMPYLEVDDKVLIESMAIARYVARDGGLLGKSSFEQAVIESVVDTISDLFEKAVVTRFTLEGPHKEAAVKQFAEKHFVNVANLLETFLGDKKYLATGEISLADLHFFSVFEMLNCLSEIVNSLPEPWEKSRPKLKALFDRVAAHPRIAEHLKSRQQTEF